jgi:biotin synthase-like enzyme
MKEVRFSRAIFLSWYCSKGDCTFCWMSTQKDLIREPKKARRRFESIFCEAAISAACGWDIEFLSGGYDSFTTEELIYITRNVHAISGKKQWLNFGTMKHGELAQFKPYAEGYCGTVECVNEDIRREVCPSKPMSDILRMFKECDTLGLKKAITIIIGIGETIADFPLLAKFIEEHKISRITFYSLNPQKGTVFRSSPSIDYYGEWISLTRKTFPNIHIIAGAWRDKLDYFSRLIDAGADDITKFPALKEFGKLNAIAVEESLAPYGFMGTLTKKPNDVGCYLDGLEKDIRQRVMDKIRDYGFLRM